MFTMGYIFKNKFYTLIFIIFDFLGYFIFLPFRFLPKRKLGSVKNILLIRLDHVGDLIYSTAVLKDLRSCYPDAKITFLVANWAKDIVQGNPFIDEVIYYDAPWFNRCKHKTLEFVGYFSLLRRIRKAKFDLGLDLRGDFRHILLMSLAGVRYKVGYGVTGGAFLLDKRVEYRRAVHCLERNLDVLRSLNIPITVDKLGLCPKDSDKKLAEDIFRNNNIAGGDFIIVLHTQAGYSSKNWPQNRFAELISILHKNYNVKMILVGDSKDRKPADDIIKLSNAPALNFSGVTSLLGLAAIIEKSSLFIGLDSAPSHIAALTGIPTIVLYSGTNDPKEWAPRVKNVIVIRKDVPCKSCQKESCDDNLCMRLISVEDVLNAIKIKKEPDYESCL